MDDVKLGVCLDDSLEDIERAYVKKAIEASDNNKNKAADLLGISLRSMRYRFDKLGFDK